MKTWFPSYIAGICMAISGSAWGFELLSEGAMGTVSAVSANSADEILNVAGSTAAGLTIDDDYESLPFQVDPANAVYDTDEVATELNFVLTREVEAWAQSLREEGFQVGVTDQIPESAFDDDAFFIPEIIVPPLPFELEQSDDEEVAIIESGRVDSVVELLEAGVNDVTFEVRREVERTAIIDARPFNDQPAIGSVFLFDLTSRSNVGISNIRD